MRSGKIKSLLFAVNITENTIWRRYTRWTGCLFSYNLSFNLLNVFTWIIFLVTIWQFSVKKNHW